MIVKYYHPKFVDRRTALINMLHHKLSHVIVRIVCIVTVADINIYIYADYVHIVYSWNMSRTFIIPNARVLYNPNINISTHTVPLYIYYI